MYNKLFICIFYYVRLCTLYSILIIYFNQFIKKKNEKIKSIMFLCVDSGKRKSGKKSCMLVSKTFKRTLG